MCIRDSSETEVIITGRCKNQPIYFDLASVHSEMVCHKHYAEKGVDIKSITIKELKILLSQSIEEILLIDVRNQNEYNQCSIQGSMLIPLGTIESGKAINEIKNLAAKKNLYIFCKSGKRSLRALKHLNKFGIRGINIEGGIEAWNNDKN